MDDKGVEDAAILLMSLGEEEASEVFKHLAPKEVQKLGETIAKMKVVPRERVEKVLDKFDRVAETQSTLVNDTDEYVRAVLRKALGDDKANLLLDRILQGSDVSSIESLKQHLEIGEALGLEGIVLHVGSSKGSTTDESLFKAEILTNCL